MPGRDAETELGYTRSAVGRASSDPVAGSRTPAVVSPSARALRGSERRGGQPGGSVARPSGL